MVNNTNFSREFHRICQRWEVLPYHYVARWILAFQAMKDYHSMDSSLSTILPEEPDWFEYMINFDMTDYNSKQCADIVLCHCCPWILQEHDELGDWFTSEEALDSLYKYE